MSLSWSPLTIPKMELRKYPVYRHHTNCKLCFIGKVYQGLNMPGCPYTCLTCGYSFKPDIIGYTEVMEEVVDKEKQQKDYELHLLREKLSQMGRG